MKDFSAQRVPAYAAEQRGDPADFDPIRGIIELGPVALSLSPDAYRWWLDHELNGLRRTMMSAYYDQRG